VPPEELFELVPDILREPLSRRGGGVYRGRFEIRGLQWLLNPDDLHATTAISARDIATAAANGLIWTDQRVQRGIKPEAEGKKPAVELSLADGYPNGSLYVFDPEKSDEIADKLLQGEEGLKLSPLVWNLRPDHFQAAIDNEEGRGWFYLYRGRFYLPDGHHRHQGILKAFHLWEDAPGDYPKFDPERMFTVDLYFMSIQDEAEYFFQKNWLPRSVARSKSYDLTEQDPPSVLAKRLIERADSLTGNVNRVTDQLAASNPQLVTLSTLREMMSMIFDSKSLNEEEIEQAATMLAKFWEMMVGVRPELRRLEANERRESRRQSMVGQAVTMYGYAELMRRFLDDIEEGGEDAAVAAWKKRLKKLRASEKYKHPPPSKFSGDFFGRDNPLWAELGVLQMTKSGRQTVSNTRQTRDQMAEALVSRLKL
jgi:hypothetical protein